jgi:hypothetical protein
MGQYRLAANFTELLRDIAAHPASGAGGDDEGNDLVFHESVRPQPVEGPSLL